MSKTGKFLFVGIVCLLFFANAWGADFMEEVSESRLQNGLKVILLENHKAPVVSFQVWYRAGSRRDAWGKTGLAHLFEHLMFKGTETVGRNEFTRRLHEIGGTYNAFTSHDFAAYFENVASDHVNVPVRLEADRMKNLVFTEEDFETEKKVVMEERRLRTQDQPQAFLDEQLAASAFQTQPYHWPVIGWMGDLMRIGYGDAVHFYDKYYSPSNAFLVVIGDFEKERILTDISEAFGGIPRGKDPVSFRYEDPPQNGERRIRVSRQASLPYIVLAYHVPNLPHEDAYVLEVLAAVLSGGKSSRLHKNIVLERNLALRAGSEYTLLSVDPPLFRFFAEPLPGRGASELEEALAKEIERLQQEEIGEQELQKAKNLLESAFVINQDSLFFQGMLLARYEIVTRWQDVRDYVPAVREVSAGDIRRVAKKYFQPSNRTVGVLEPLETQGMEGEGKEKGGAPSS